MPTRRRFLAVSASAMTAAAFPKRLFAALPSSEAFSAATTGAYQQGILTQASFQSVLNTLFMAMLGDNKVSYMHLISSTDTSTASKVATPQVRPTAMVKGPTSASAQVTSFQAVFKTDGTVFDQGSYVLDHGTLGRFVCFLVPSAPGSVGAGTCTATFSYLAGSTAAAPIWPIDTPVSSPVSSPTSGTIGAPVSAPIARPIVMPVPAPIVRPGVGGTSSQIDGSPGGVLTNN